VADQAEAGNDPAGEPRAHASGVETTAGSGSAAAPKPDSPAASASGRPSPSSEHLVSIRDTRAHERVPAAPTSRRPPVESDSTQLLPAVPPAAAVTNGAARRGDAAEEPGASSVRRPAGTSAPSGTTTGSAAAVTTGAAVTSSVAAGTSTAAGASAATGASKAAGASAAGGTSAGRATGAGTPAGAAGSAGTPAGKAGVPGSKPGAGGTKIGTTRGDVAPVASGDAGAAAVRPVEGVSDNAGADNAGAGDGGPAPTDLDEVSAEFALVRPYVTTLGDDSEEERPTGRHSAELMNFATMRIPLVTTSRAARQAPSAGEDPVRPARRGRFVAVAALLVVVAAGGMYALMRPGSSTTVSASTPASAMIPAVPTRSHHASPSASPSTDDAPPPVTKTHAASSHTKKAVPATSKSPHHSPSASAPPFAPGPSVPPATGVDLAAHRPIDDSGHTQNYVGSNAVDGNPQTYWESSSGSRFPQTITVDLGSSQSVDRVVLSLPPGQDWATRTEGVAISTSTTGWRRSFGLVAMPAGLTFNPASGNTVTIRFSSRQARYVRLTVFSNSALPAAQLSELGVYSS